MIADACRMQSRHKFSSFYPGWVELDQYRYWNLYGDRHLYGRDTADQKQLESFQSYSITRWIVFRLISIRFFLCCSVGGVDDRITFFISTPPSLLSNEIHSVTIGKRCFWQLCDWCCFKLAVGVAVHGAGGGYNSASAAWLLFDSLWGQMFM